MWHAPLAMINTPAQSHAFGDTAAIVLAMLRDRRRGAVLDVAAGEGFLSAQLTALGFTVVAGDIAPRGFAVADLGCAAVDLNQPLPYEDRQFDYVCLLETLEHLRNPGLCLDELARVLRPDGELFLSLPNLTSLQSRIVFLLSGQYHNFYDADWSCRYENGADRHILPLPRWVVERLLVHAGFEIRSVRYSLGGIEVPRRKRPWLKLVLFPRSPLFGNSVIIHAARTSSDRARR